MTGPRLFAALDGYAVEGGYDGLTGPTTCYAPSIALGRLAGPAATGLFDEYEVVLDAAAGLGLDGVRLSVEWTRVEPRRGEVDEATLARYGAVVEHARDLGLSVTVVLFDAVWPLWAGLEAWLLPWVAPMAIAHGRRVANALSAANGVIVAPRAADLVSEGFLEGSAPPFRTGATVDAASAHASLARIVSTLAEDDAVSPRLVDSWRELRLDALSTAAASVLASGMGAVHLRSLVAGTGPTAAATGLLERRAGVWTPSEASALLGLLR